LNNPELVGAELARDGGIIFNIDVDWPTAIAGKLGSYRVTSVFLFQVS
jgi:hypothetical protein